MPIDIRGLCPLLQVFDMPASLRFYRDILGFAEVGKSGEGDDVDWARLRHGHAEVMLNTAYERGKRPPTPEATRVAAHDDTGLFMGCEDLDGAYAYLVAQGVKARPPKIAPYGMKQLYARDPDGYGLCFQWPAEQENQGRRTPPPLLTASEREAIAELWSQKLSQDARGLPQSERHRNLEPASAEFICALAAGSGAQRLLEVGGSSGLSTIALAAAARHAGGRLVSIEIEPARQALARQRLASLGLADRVDFVLADAGQVLGEYDALEFVLIDCEKEDYERFLALLRLAPAAVVVADNILSHGLGDYVSAVRSYPGVESVTLAIGKGLELSRFVIGSAGRS